MRVLVVLGCWPPLCRLQFTQYCHFNWKQRDVEVGSPSSLSPRGRWSCIFSFKWCLRDRGKDRIARRALIAHTQVLCARGFDRHRYLSAADSAPSAFARTGPIWRKPKKYDLMQNYFYFNVRLYQCVCTWCEAWARSHHSKVRNTQTKAQIYQFVRHFPGFSP